MIRIEGLEGKFKVLGLRKIIEQVNDRKLNRVEYIEKEGNDAMEEFSGIVEDETERIQQVANKEKERIMQESRANGTIDICPLCLDEISPIRTPEEANQGVNRMLCCGVLHCNDCVEDSMDYMFGKSRKERINTKCYSCREPMSLVTEMAKTIKPNDKRHALLNSMANFYINGSWGLKKNTKKGINLYQRSAELGNISAQGKLAEYYFLGKFVPKCLQKARYYAEKSAAQGIKSSQYILAQLIKDSDNNSEEEVFRLYTLASFQGSENGRIALGMHYYKRYHLMASGGEDWKRNLLLTLYWFGKAAEVETKTPEGCESLALMAFHLNLAMQVWHPGRFSDPLPRYSHIPLFYWALAKGGQYTHRYSKGPFDYVWKHKCANCGSGEKEQLKACARCKAFHYCSKKCQVEHWKDGHKVDCRGHWIEKHFPAIRKAQE